MLAPLRTLLASIVDYAGIFPPANLDLPTAMACYHQYQRSPQAWMLGRFILPLSRLDEFEALSPQFSQNTWPLSLIVGGELETAIARLKALKTSPIRVAAIEYLPTHLETIPEAHQKFQSIFSDRIETFFELSLTDDWASGLSILKQCHAAAKIRTGGMTVHAFPNPFQLAEFVLACAQAQVSFKATAGLHHLFPGTYAITQAPTSPLAPMYGFLNVALLAALTYYHNLDLETAVTLLNVNQPRHLLCTEQSLEWKSYSLTAKEIEQTRHRFFRAFGSCSFQEPIHELALAFSGQTHAAFT